MSRAEVFGSLLAPKLRWWCACGRANVTSIGAPVRQQERVFCKGCRKPSTFKLTAETKEKTP